MDILLEFPGYLAGQTHFQYRVVSKLCATKVLVMYPM